MPLVEQLRYWAGQLEGVSALLDVTVVACQGLPARYSGQEDIAVATPAPGLGHPPVLRSRMSDATHHRLAGQLTRVLAALTTTPAAPLGR